jgi:hypothetical protein
VKIYTTAVSFSDVADGGIFKCDTIEYQGKMWLVPEWLENPKAGWTMPARIILLESLPHQTTTGNAFGDFVLNQPIPKAVFNGQQSGGIYIVLERPDIKIKSLGGIH